MYYSDRSSILINFILRLPLAVIRLPSLGHNAEEKCLAAFRSAMESKGKLEQTIMHCILFGYSGAGKSSLLNRLMKRPPIPALPSTGVAEKALLVDSEVCRLSTVASHSIGKGSSKSTWSVLSYDDEAISLMVAANATPTHSKEAMETSQASGISSTEIEIPSTRAVPTAVAPAGPTVQADTALPMNCLRQAIKHKGLEKMQQNLQQSLQLYLTDTGGQMEFREMLPALNAGPALFFLVFRLDQDLDETVHIQYRYIDGDSSKPYRSSFTVRESLLQSLASIASMGSYKHGTKLEDPISMKQRVIFIGTHRDKVSTRKVQQCDRRLKEMVKATSLYHEGLIEFASESQLMIAVNNLSPYDSDFQQVRSVVKRTADRDNFRISLPSTWLIFSIIIRQHEKRVITYDECFDIGQQCGIGSREELNEALFFLSTKAGLVRHFRGEGLEDLERIVIVDPQIIFDKITRLIFNTFTVSNTTASVCEEFKNKGIFPLSVLQQLSTDNELLTVNQFVTLLEHLNIISRLHTEEVMYFMPCTLPHAESPLPERDVEQHVPPLLLTFKCDYCPMGLFSALVVHLLANKMKSKLNWELQTERIFRNVISIGVGPYDTVTIKLTPKHLEVAMIPAEVGRKRSLNVGAVCTEVRQCIETAIQEVTSTLHYTSDAGHTLAFHCTCKHKIEVEQHPARIVFFRDDPSRLVCKLDGQKHEMQLPDNYQYWWFSRELEDTFMSTSYSSASEREMAVNVTRAAVLPPLSHTTSAEFTQAAFLSPSPHSWSASSSSLSVSAPAPPFVTPQPYPSAMASLRSSTPSQLSSSSSVKRSAPPLQSFTQPPFAAASRLPSSLRPSPSTRPNVMVTPHFHGVPFPSTHFGGRAKAVTAPHTLIAPDSDESVVSLDVANCNAYLKRIFLSG